MPRDSQTTVFRMCRNQCLAKDIKVADHALKMMPTVTDETERYENTHSKYSK
jgi:hypothetical protein